MKNIWTGKRERKFSAASLLIFGAGAVFTLIALSNSQSANEELRQSSIKESISKSAALLTEEPPLVLYEKNGEETPELKRIFEIYHGTGTVSCGDAHRESR